MLIISQLIPTRLAYCGTPMILAAIDSKLSPSQSASIERGTALHYCSEVVTQSRGTYDITEFFSQGTNHLLHLAYRVTDNVFREGLGKTARHSITLSDKVREGHEKTSCLPIIHFKNLRVKGWVEAFLKYPRAYLSISACIDHSLATGRLPRDDALPPLISATLPLVLGLPTLPWMINSPVQEEPKFEAASLIEDPPKPQSEEITHPTGYSLNDPWYWSLLHNFSAEGEDVESVGFKKSDPIQEIIDFDSDNVVAGSMDTTCPDSFTLPNMGIISGDNSP